MQHLEVFKRQWLGSGEQEVPVGCDVVRIPLRLKKVQGHVPMSEDAYTRALGHDLGELKNRTEAGRKLILFSNVAISSEPVQFRLAGPGPVVQNLGLSARC